MGVHSLGYRDPARSDEHGEEGGPSLGLRGPSEKGDGVQPEGIWLVVLGLR